MSRPSISIAPDDSQHVLLLIIYQVGNEAFANYVDAHVMSLAHVNNKKDPIPILPGRFLGYAHPSGEVHIEESGAWDSCPGNEFFGVCSDCCIYPHFLSTGQDNPSGLCIVGAVPEIWDGDMVDHDGPYDDVGMGC